MIPTPILLTAYQYAAAKGITRQTVYNHLRNGKLPCQIIAGRKFVDTSLINSLNS